MKKEYTEIMDKIKITDEMHDRILNNIHEINLNHPSKMIQFSKFKKQLSIAACFLMLLVGISIVPNIINNYSTPTHEGSPIMTYSSVEELSKALKFSVQDIINLPFHIETTTYSTYNDEIANIVYSNNEQQAIFRKSLGSEDNSGDFTNYTTISNVNINSYSVTLKGTQGMYNLAIWIDGEYSYSLNLSFELSESEWVQIISNIN